jgi:hypothetical protein
MRREKIKYDYEIHYRQRNSHTGIWSEWFKGFGVWQSHNESERIEQLQKQLRLLFTVPKTIEIKIIRDGNLINYKGEIINESLLYEKR